MLTSYSQDTGSEALQERTMPHSYSSNHKLYKMFLLYKADRPGLDVLTGWEIRSRLWEVSRRVDAGEAWAPGGYPYKQHQLLCGVPPPREECGSPSSRIRCRFTSHAGQTAPHLVAVCSAKFVSR